MNGLELLDMLTRYQSSVQSRAMTTEEAKASASRGTVSRASMVKALDTYIDARIDAALKRSIVTDARGKAI